MAIKIVGVRVNIRGKIFWSSSTPTEWVKVVDFSSVTLTRSKFGPKLSLTDKIGSTSCFRDRVERDIKEMEQKNIRITEDDYVLVCDFDNVDLEFNSHLENEYEKFMKTMTNDENISPGQRRFFKALHLHEGDKLGAKRSIMLQMLECALQREYKFGAPAEFLMYADDVVDR